MAPLDHWYAALANCTKAPVNVLLMGDSIQEKDRGPANESFRIPRRFARAIQEKYMGEVQSLGYVPMSPPSSGTLWSFSTTPGSLPIATALYGLSRYAHIFPPLAAPAWASITLDCDRFWLIGTGGGVPDAPAPGAQGATVTIDGGAPITLPRLTDVWGRILYDSGPLAPGEHTILVTGPNAGGQNLYAEGIFPFLGDHDAGIHIWESCVGGTAASYYLDSASTHWADVMDTIQPDLVLIEFGINEMVGALPGTAATPSQFSANLDALVTKIKTQRPLSVLPSFALMPMWAIGLSPFTADSWLPYHDAMVSLAAARGWAIAPDIYALAGWIGPTDPQQLTIDLTHANEYNGKPLIVNGMMDALTSAVVPLFRPAGYLTVAEMRALPNLGDSTVFSDDDLLAALSSFETTFEEFTGVAFVERQDTYLATGDGTPSLMLPHYPVRSITAVRLYTSASDFTDYTTDELAELVPTEWGEIKRYSGRFWPWSLFGAPNIQITYTHGFDAPPADVKRAAKTAIQDALMQDLSGRPNDRTYGTATEGIFVRNIIEDEKHPFGLASVDAVACRYRKRYRAPAIA